MERIARCLMSTGALVCCLSLTGCGSSSPMTMDNFNKLKEGMTIEEVSQIFGFPTPVKPDEPNLGRFYVQQNRAGVDRKTEWISEESTIDTFVSKELGGVNEKTITIRYDLGKAALIEQTDLDKP